MTYSTTLRKIFGVLLTAPLLAGLAHSSVAAKPITSSLPSINSQTAAAFLEPPYPGTATNSSVFDHSDPTYTINFTITAYTGDQATFNCPPDKQPPIDSDGVHCWFVRKNDPETPSTLYWSYTLNDWLSYDGHNGIDYAISYRHVFAAAASDQVVEARWSDPQNHRGDGSGYGLFVKLHHANGYQTLYGHLSVISVERCNNPGCASIAQGQTIGISGNTGESTGNHLHFSVYNSAGVAVDPYGWAGAAGTDPNGANQPESLWAIEPELTGLTIYPRGTGNALPFPVTPTPGVKNLVVHETITDANSCWVSDVGGYNSDLHYTGVAPGGATCPYQWAVPASIVGVHEVYAYIPSAHSTTEGAQYYIHHQGIASLAIVHQAQYGANASKPVGLSG